MANHVKAGAEYLRQMVYPEDVVGAVISSHEHQKHSYPRKTNLYPLPNMIERRKKVTPLHLDILSAADEFAALSEHRPYHKILSSKGVESAMADSYRGEPIFPSQLFETHHRLMH